MDQRKSIHEELQRGLSKVEGDPDGSIDCTYLVSNLQLLSIRQASGGG